MRSLVFFLGACAFVAGGAAGAQMSRPEAKAEAEALAEGVRDGSQDQILSNAAPDGVPGFQGTDAAEATYFEDPERLLADGEAARYSEGYTIVADPYRTQFDPATLGLENAQTVEADPESFLGGVSFGGSTGECQPLPTGGGGGLTYLESCNQGSVPFDEARSCTASLNVQVSGRIAWEHQCFPQGFIAPPNQNHLRCPAFQSDAQAQGASCSFVRQEQVGIVCLQGTPNNCTEPEPLIANIYACDAPVAGWGSVQIDTRTVSGESVDETACQNTTTGATCSLETETCTAPNETRNIGGLDVTRPCWEWERTYQCQGASPANDCGELDARPECSFSHDECLSYDPDGMTCNVYDRWYSCTIPQQGDPPPPEFVCGDDLYCLDGECNSIEREASTEFKDAVVAIETMGELNADFDPATLTVFGGEHLECSKKLFGISNCCSGKGVPLITPFLCDAEDREVDRRDDEGLCHNVGTYCSSKVLGVCVSKKQSYCCFSSKLVRILQEQGREQLGKSWQDPEEPNCDGFLISEFQQLDLSQMDFTEVYSEFVEAARLPDEVELSIQIQSRIEDYFNTATGGG